jgi:hypothetical protein
VNENGYCVPPRSTEDGKVRDVSVGAVVSLKIPLLANLKRICLFRILKSPRIGARYAEVRADQHDLEVCRGTPVLSSRASTTRWCNFQVASVRRCLSHWCRIVSSKSISEPPRRSIRILNNCFKRNCDSPRMGNFLKIVSKSGGFSITTSPGQVAFVRPSLSPWTESEGETKAGAARICRSQNNSDSGASLPSPP